MRDIEELRKNTRKNQSEFAQIIGIKKQSQYSDLLKDIKENNKILPIKYGINIANYFDISLDYIYSEYLKTTEKNIEIQEKINKLSDNEKKNIIAIIDNLLSK